MSDAAARRLEVALLAALALFSLIPLALILRRAGADDRVWAGADGPSVGDQFQYMSWIREYGGHLLAGNDFDLRPRSRVFFHPMFALSGWAWQLGVSIPIAYLLWKPVAVAALFLGFRAYVARFLTDSTARVAALATALFFATPVAALMSLASETREADVRHVAGELFPANLLWGYLPAAISVGLMPLFLLGVERLVRAAPEGRLVARPRELALVSACGAVVSWLHPWQGQVLLVVVVGAVALGRFSRRYAVLAIPALATFAPIAYYFVLSRADSAWELAAQANASRGDVPVWAVVVALLPLAVPALLGLRGAAVDLGERMLWLWPLAALAGYLVLSPSFPQHAFEGMSLPLAILAVRGLSGLRHRTAWVAALAAFAILPGTVYLLDWLRDRVDAGGQPFALRDDERDALDHVERAREPGGVLPTVYLGSLVPAATGRQTWVGHPSWTPEYDSRVRLADELFSGRLPRSRAIGLVRASGAAFVVRDCGYPAAAIERLRPAVTPMRSFGCAAVYRVEG